MLTTGQLSLKQQGYNSCSTQELKNISNGLRFTPLVCMGLAILGLFIQNPYWHFALAGLGILPFWFPSYHPLDLLYNSVIRHIVKGEKLPANPLQRRIACVMGGLMNVGIGFGFLYENLVLAYIFAAILIPLQIIVISTHFCVASWFYESLMKTLGIWNGPISKKEIQKLLSKGAMLIDVRSTSEYGDGHLPNAINLPVEIIDNAKIEDRAVILYCKSGIRSMDALNKLEKKGVKNVYNMGRMERWYEEGF